MLTARMAGCVLAVFRRSPSGPSDIKRSRPPPSAASASSSAARASGWAWASAWPMPTYCDPCPGKTKASFIERPPSPAHESAPPRHAAADRHHEDEVTVLESAIAVRLIERERDRGRRGVAHLLDVQMALLERNLQRSEERRVGKECRSR